MFPTARLLVCLYIFCLPLFGQVVKTADAPDITAYRVSRPLKIDADLDEPIYQSDPFDYFIQEEPDNGEPASEKSNFWVGYDDKAIYIGARLYDSNPDSIITRMGRRDADLNSDDIQIAIDSYNDNRSGYFFIINPSGAINDGTFSNDGDFSDTWDGIWEGTARITNDGWTAELRIPFSQLRFNQDDEIVMGLGFGRNIKRKNEHDLSFQMPRGEPGIASRFGDLIGIRNITPPRRIEFSPYLTADVASLESEADNPFYNGKDSGTGLGTDLKIGIGNNLTIDATINPDFGQVEVDPSVINLTAYETYYDEKRPFFVEGANIFGFGNGGPSNRMGFNFSHPNYFYSRRIGRTPQGSVDSDGWIEIPTAATILGAAKISGKLPGNLSIGGLSALTRREFAQVDEDTLKWKTEVEPLTSYNLIRGSKELSGGLHGIGGLATYLIRDFEDQRLRSELTDQALGIGLDGWTFFDQDRQWALSGWLGLTHVEGSAERITEIQESYNHYFQKPDVSHVSVDRNRTSLDGWSARFNLNKEKGNLRFNSAMGVISPGFESNDMGINSRTDQINKHLFVGYEWYDPGTVFRSKSIATAYMSNHNFAGDKINQMIFLFGHLRLLNYYGMHFSGGWGPRTLDDTKLRGGPLVGSPAGKWGEIEFFTDGRKNISFELEFNGVSGENGYWEYAIDPSAEIKLGTRLNLRVNPEYSASHSIAQYITTVDDPLAESMYGKRYIFAELNRKTFEASLRLDYTFTPRLSFQAYFQGLMATGTYSDYKEFARPRSLEYLHYSDEDLVIKYDEPSDEYYVIESKQPMAHEIDEDFNEKSLIGSAVLRWEFRPGSILYVVWTRNSADDTNPGDFNFSRDFGDMWKAAPDNVLALKLTWWIG